ncbi:hypothetical protein QFC21_004880 [Naganishia friedmannii]|uniref:Uncharacterized protein n=1 Tax=Naganishia friedmannii TaxID=89922 RepID=A0ACC2VF24_9TREE|nr:hypothetical protein QFC21_004880 [Naganishia friedmannii]
MSNPSMPRPTNGITHPALIQFLQTILPPAPNHLPLIYHTPRSSHNQRITRIVLSITPTASIYTHLTPTTAIFLHRPWSLQRQRLHRSTLVLASHQRLDELLTTGYNEVLLRGLGVQGGMEGIVGYKGDPERKMGLVGRLPTRIPLRDGENDGGEEDRQDGEERAGFADWVDRIRREFPDVEITPPLLVPLDADIDSFLPPPMDPPLYIACMNAFDPEIIDRAITAAASLSHSQPDTTTTTLGETAPFHPSQIIYLTGQPRAPGLAHAGQTGIRPLFAGHRGAEAWAIRYLAGRLRAEWGGEEGHGVEVVVVDEPEEVVMR